MKKLLLTAASLTLLASLAWGQTQTISFDDNNGPSDMGSYNPNDTFTLDVNLTLSGYDEASLQATGLSYALQVSAALAPHISITSISYFTFTDSTQPGVPKIFDDPSGANPGFLSERFNDGMSLDQGDLGASASTSMENQMNGMFMITQLTFSLSGAPLGDYTLATTTLSPKTSIVSDQTFLTDHPIPQADYMLSVVPEPSTWSLLVLGGLGTVGLITLRKKHRA